MYVRTNMSYTFTPDSQPYYYTLSHTKSVAQVQCIMFACTLCIRTVDGILLLSHIRTYSKECELTGPSEFVCPMHTTQSQVPNEQQGLKGLL